jgi:hypothetical protein
MSGLIDWLASPPGWPDKQRSCFFWKWQDNTVGVDTRKGAWDVFLAREGTVIVGASDVMELAKDDVAVHLVVLKGHHRNIHAIPVHVWQSRNHQTFFEHVEEYKSIPLLGMLEVQLHRTPKGGLSVKLFLRKT